MVEGICPLRVATVVFRFGGKNFYLWKFKMQMFQEEKELWKVMSSTQIKPTENSLEWEKKKEKLEP